MSAYSGPFPGGVAAGSAFSEVNVHHTTFSGNVTNSGTISGGGIVVTSSTFLSGGIIDSGINSGGISIDSRSKIIAKGAVGAGATGVLVENTTTFGGRISNAGRISASTGHGIVVSNVAVFGVGGGAGGITNSGTIAAKETALKVFDVTVFSGASTTSARSHQ